MGREAGCLVAAVGVGVLRVGEACAGLGEELFCSVGLDCGEARCVFVAVGVLPDVVAVGLDAGEAAPELLVQAAAPRLMLTTKSATMRMFAVLPILILMRLPGR